MDLNFCAAGVEPWPLRAPQAPYARSKLALARGSSLAARCGVGGPFLS